MPQYSEIQTRLALKVGESQNADGAIIDGRSGKQGDLIVSGLHGKFTEQALRGNVYSACNQAAVAITAALATTYTGFVISNPATSGYNLAVLEAGFAAAAAMAAGAVGLMYGTTSSAIAAAITPVNRKLGGKGSVAVVDDGSTLPSTPVLLQVIGEVGSVATTSYGTVGPHICKLDGSLIIPPGYYVAFYHTAGHTAAIVCHMVWEEIPV